MIKIARSNLSKVAFENNTDFDSYIKHNQIYTFRRVDDALEVIVPKQSESELSFDICLEDAYMWVISDENSQYVTE